jgi:hypothetical protein
MRKMMTCCALLIAAVASADEWSLVTETSELQAGDQIVLAYSDKSEVASTSIAGRNSKYLTAVEATFTGDVISVLPSDAAVFTLSGNASAWTLTNQNGEVLGASSAKHLTWDSGTMTWLITSEGVSSTKSSYGDIQYNDLNGSARFCNYTSSQKPIQIYRLTASGPSVQIVFEGFPYYRTSCDQPTFRAGTEFILPSATPEKEGKKLTGWFYDGKTYNPGDTFIVPESDVLFVPVWEGGEGVEQTAGASRTWRKEMRNGMFYIVCEGQEFTILGERVQ